MSKQANATVIGGFVLGAVVLVVIGIIVFSSGALFRERVELVTYFPGSVQGLNVGAQVQFQGVPIGQVTAIDLDYLPERDSFRIPVRYEIWPTNVHVLGNIGDSDTRDVLQRLVDEKGLRARLEPVSLVTGQYVVVLGLNPALPRRTFAGNRDEAIRVPAVAATRDRIEEMLANLRLDDLVSSFTATLEAIQKLLESGIITSTMKDLDETLVETRGLVQALGQSVKPMVARVDGTLADYGRLAKTLDARAATLAESLEGASNDIARLARELNGEVAPLSSAAVRTLEDTRGAMRAISSLAGQGSSTRYELDQLLAELTRTARSLRSLADYLERHPEALLQGKR